MSTIKKLLALVLALTMVLSVSAAAAYAVAPYGDAAGIDADCEEAVQVLYNLNIMKGDNKGNFNPEATITRAEVAKMIYVILNYGEDDLAKNYTGAKIFSDVEAGLWYEGYINYAATTKLVQGRPDGTFGPNDPITCAEAAKMLLTAIGYSAEARGYTGAGWDKQVLSDASIIGLLDGYDYNTNTYAPRQWVAVMFFNALTKAYTYGNIAPVVFNGLLTGVNYDADYVNFGWKYFELESWSGIIVANEYADLYGAKPLSSDRTQIRYTVDKKYEYTTFKNWSTDLTEIGEYREGWNCGSKVVYVGGEDENVEFMTGEATNLTTDSKFKSATGIKNGGEYYVNFAEKDFDSTVNGDWLRVVDNDDDGTADYVFKTTFTMSTFIEVDDDDHAWVTDGTDDGLKFSDGYYELYEDAAEDDVVIYTTIDGVTYIELAPSFSGEAQKYTYKNRTLTVDDADYDQSDIAFNTSLDYYSDLELANKDIEYTYYKDFFNHIRLYGRDKADNGDLVLLTDAYYQTGRNGSVAAVDAYLDGEIKDTDVRNSAAYTDINMFIDGRTSSSNAWNKLRAFEGAVEGKTMLARYSMNDEGVLSLYDAETWIYNNLGNPKALKTQYIDMNNIDLDAGQASYYGYARDVAYDDDATPAYTNTYVDVNDDGAIDALDEVRVQANRDTVFYYVSYNTGSPVVKTVTGYKNTFDVIDSIVDIRAFYAVATDVEADSAKDSYWVADAIVVETYYPVFSLLEDDIVLGYDIVNRSVADYAYMDVVKADASLGGLNVISHNGDDFDTFTKKGDLQVLNFFFNTVDEEGNSYLVDLNKAAADDYVKNDIFVGTVDRANVMYDYVTLVAGTHTYDDGDELIYTEDTVVYNVTENTRYNSIKTVSAGLQTGKDYIFFAPKGEVVFAVLVDDALTEALYDDILADCSGAATTSLAAAKIAAKAALKNYAKLITENKWNNTPGVTADDLAEVLDAELKKISDATTVAAVEALVTADADGDCYGSTSGKAVADKALAVVAANATAEANKANKVKTDAIAKAIEGMVIAADKADLDTDIQAALAAKDTESVATFTYEMPDYTLGVSGQQTVPGVKVTVKVGAAESVATVSVKITY